MKKHIRGIGAIIAGCMLLTDTMAVAGAEPAAVTLFEADVNEAGSDTVANVSFEVSNETDTTVYEAAAEDEADTFDHLYEKRGRDLTGSERKVYDGLSELAAQVADGKQASAVLELTLGDLEELTEFSLADLDVTAFKEGEVFTAETQKALEAGFSVDMNKVMTALLADEPYALYWYDEGHADAATVTYSFTGTVSEDGDVLTLDDTSRISVSLMVSAAYSASGEAGTTDVNKTETAKVSKAVKDRANAIVSDAGKLDPAPYEYLPDHKRMEYYMTRIHALAEYDDTAADPGALQLTNVLGSDDETKTTSRGLARAFKYLCDLTEFRSGWTAVSTVTGTVTYDGKTEDHTWNLVQMDDGKVYLADTALCDTDEVGENKVAEELTYPGGLFMVGTADGSPEAGYVFVPNGKNVIYRYDETTKNLYEDDELKVAAAGVYAVPDKPQEEPGVQVTGVTLTSEDTKTKELDYRLGMDTPKPLKVSVKPDNAADTDFTLTSSNESAVTVERSEDTGVLTLAGVGVSKITVTTSDGNYSDTLFVTVRYATPAAKEQGDDLGGLEPGGTYKIAVGKGAATEYTADSEKGSIPIPAEWRNKSISIVRADAVFDRLNSDAQILKIGKKAVVYDEESGVSIAWAEDEESYTYTGKAIKPAVVVYNESTTFAEKTDYVVKYKKNVNAGTAKVIVKASKKSKKLSKKFYKELPFEIVARDINEGVEAPAIFVYSGKKAKPFLLFGKKKLTAGKDFEYDTTATYEENGSVAVTGIENFTGERTVEVYIRTKKAGKLKAKEFKGEDYEPLVYDGTEQYPEVTVYDPKGGKDEDGMPAKVLEEGKDYLIGWPMNCTDAGTHKYTIYGIGEDYAGTVTKSYKIKGVKLWEKKEDIEWPTNMEKDEETGKIEYDTYPYDAGGVTLEDDDSLFGLDKGTDYTIKYSGNKKLGVATYTIKFKKNYGRTKSLKGKFKIVPADIAADAGATLYLPPQCFAGDPGTYAATPYVVCDNEYGSLLKKGKDYTIRYFLDEKRSDDKEITKDRPVTAEDLDGKTGITIYATATGKGKYDKESSIAGSYTLYNITPAMPVVNLAKDVKVTCRSIFYKGTRIDPTSDQTESGHLIDTVQIKRDGEWTELSGDELENFRNAVTVELIGANNLKVGNAALIIMGRNTPVTETPFFFGAQKTKFKIKKNTG